MAMGGMCAGRLVSLKMTLIHLDVIYSTIDLCAFYLTKESAFYGIIDGRSLAPFVLQLIHDYVIYEILFEIFDKKVHVKGSAKELVFE